MLWPLDDHLHSTIVLKTMKTAITLKKKKVKKGCMLHEQIQRAPLIPPIAKDCPDGFPRQLITRCRDLQKPQTAKNLKI